MTARIFVSRDSTARAFGADATARAIEAEAKRRGLDVTIVRNGSRGMFWLEPLVEIDAPGGRVGYGPIRPADVPALFDAGFERGNVHGLRVGPVEMIPFFERQERLTFARVGITDPVSVEDYRAHGGYRGLENALAMSGEDIVKAVTDSGLRGRGGAAFPAGIKWKTVLGTESSQKYIVCNADEGDSGTFSDRMLMEGDPLCLVEGMTIAGLAVGATQGYIYLRSEYPHAHRALNEGSPSRCPRFRPPCSMPCATSTRCCRPATCALRTSCTLPSAPRPTWISKRCPRKCTPFSVSPFQPGGSTGAYFSLKPPSSMRRPVRP